MTTARTKALILFIAALAIAGCTEAPVTAVDPADTTQGGARPTPSPAEPVAWRYAFAAHEVTCGVGARGSLECIGSSRSPRVPVVQDAPDALPLVAASSYFDGGPCGLTTERELRCVVGGMPGETIRWQQLVPGRFAAVDGGSGYGCALAEDGIPWCWWTEVISRSSSRPFHIAPVPGAPPFAQLQTGSMYACGLTAQGEALCWNFGPSGTRRTTGQLGNGSLVSSATPVRVLTDTRFVSLAAADMHACALTAEGEAWCWGSNTGNALGVPQDSSRAGCGIGGTASVPWATHWCAVPQRLGTELRFRSITAASARTCAVTAEGRAYCWGGNNGWTLGTTAASDTRCNVMGPLFDASYDISCTTKPVAVAGDVRFAALWKTSGGYHQCGAGVDGRTYCWGMVGSDGRPAAVMFSTPGVPVIGSAQPLLLRATGG